MALSNAHSLYSLHQVKPKQKLKLRIQIRKMELHDTVGDILREQVKAQLIQWQQSAVSSFYTQCENSNFLSLTHWRHGLEFFFRFTSKRIPEGKIAFFLFSFLEK